MSSKSFSKRIKGYDWFGHSVKINFNKNGEDVRTIYGGIISIITRIVIYAFLVSKLKVMILREDDSISIIEENTDFEKLGVK